MDTSQIVAMISNDSSLSGTEKLSLVEQLKAIPGGFNFDMDTLRRMGLMSLVGYLMGRGFSGTIRGGQIGAILGAATGMMYDRRMKPQSDGLPYGFTRNPY